MDRDDIWRHVHEQRRALAGVLATLSVEEWAHPSLCGGWTVRDVAAHVISSAATTPREGLTGLVRARGSFNAMVLRDARLRGRAPVERILADYRRYDGSRRRPLGTSVLDPLCDVLVHTQDVVLPLQRSHAMPVDAALAAIGRVRRIAWLFGTRRLVGSVRMEATDADWAAGHGPLLRGTAQQLLLAAAGRGRHVSGLDGPGLDLLRSGTAG